MTDERADSATDLYISELLKISSKSNVHREIESANLLMSIGKHNDALPHFEAAHALLTTYKTDDIWERFYFNNCLRYAWCLDYVGDISKAEEMFLEALRGGGIAKGDYANFLHRRKSDYTSAQRYYKMAIQEYPKHSSVHLKYAGFLRHIQKDMAGAESHYKLAVETNPSSSDALGNYASFLHGVQKKYTEAEEFYQKAVLADGSHSNNFCNFGLFLSEEKRQYEKAEGMYKHALELSPTHANSLYNYAVMLDTHCARKQEAEGLYRAALAVEGTHAYAMYNLAVLLEERHKMLLKERQALTGSDSETIVIPDSEKEEILRLYQQSSTHDPSDAIALADYGRYMLTEFPKEKCETKGEALLLRALQLDSRSETALYTLGVHYRLIKTEPAAHTAEGMFRKLLERSPGHVRGMHQLATLLLERSKKKSSLHTQGMHPIEEAFSLLQRCIELSQERTSLLAEYATLVHAHGTNRQKLAAISFVSQDCFADIRGPRSIVEAALNSLQVGATINKV